MPERAAEVEGSIPPRATLQRQLDGRATAVMTLCVWVRVPPSALPTVLRIGDVGSPIREDVRDGARVRVGLRARTSVSAKRNCVPAPAGDGEHLGAPLARRRDCPSSRSQQVEQRSCELGASIPCPARNAARRRPANRGTAGPRVPYVRAPVRAQATTEPSVLFAIL